MFLPQLFLVCVAYGDRLEAVQFLAVARSRLGSRSLVGAPGRAGITPAVFGAIRGILIGRLSFLLCRRLDSRRARLYRGRASRFFFRLGRITRPSRRGLGLTHSRL